MSKVFVGGWAPFQALDHEAKEVFAEGIEHLVGADYTPFAYSHQLVAGENFAFFCNVHPLVEHPYDYPAMVHMFKSLEGKVGITHIQRLDY